jgi:hypothetical protein
MEGLTYSERQGEAGAYEHLKFLLASPSTSFPVIAVPLGALADFDGRVELRLKPDQSFDHALLLLAMDDREVEFFDPTFNPLTAGLVREVMPTPVLLEWWRKDSIQPFYRGWVEALPPKPSPKTGALAPLSRKNLYTYDQPPVGGERRRRRK